jgi:hypothetical protein
MQGAGPDLERLRELAVRDQWSLSDLDWTGVDLPSLPAAFRQAAADAFAQLRRGERTAELAASRLAGQLRPAAARALCELQARDEARHTAFFDQVIARLECPGRVRPSTERLMAEVEEAGSPEETALGMQILIEGVAHSLFSQAGRLFEVLDASGALDGSQRATWRVVAEWMPGLLARDESRHIAFGVQFLRERLPEVGPRGRERLEEKLATWGAWVLESAHEPDLLLGVGVDGHALCGPLVEDLNLRIAQVGLNARVAPLRTA